MTAHLTICSQVYTLEQEKPGLCPYDDNGTCSPTCLMAVQIQTPTPTATVTWQRRNTWSPTSLSLAQSLSFGTQNRASLGDIPDLPGASNSLAHWTWRTICLMVTPTVSSMGTSSQWLSE